MGLDTEPANAPPTGKNASKRTQEELEEARLRQRRVLCAKLLAEGGEQRLGVEFRKPGLLGDHICGLDDGVGGVRRPLHARAGAGGHDGRDAKVGAARPPADERVAAHGKVLRELDRAQLRIQLEGLKARGTVQALTICFINAYQNGANERAAREVAREVFPDMSISISSEVVPEMQEYERMRAAGDFDAMPRPKRGMRGIRESASSPSAGP